MQRDGGATIAQHTHQITAAPTLDGQREACANLTAALGHKARVDLTTHTEENVTARSNAIFRLGGNWRIQCSIGANLYRAQTAGNVLRLQIAADHIDANRAADVA